MAQKVFNELISNGPMTARQIAERLDIPRPSAYDQVKSLIKKELVLEKVVENKKVFIIDDIKNIQKLLNDKIESLEAEKAEFEKSLPNLLKQFSFIEPQIKFYTGREGVKQVMGHIMQNRDIETLLMWPMSEMLKVLGSEYLAEINAKRIKRNISIRGVWPEDKKIDPKDHPYLGVGEGHLRELRLAPKGLTWNMGYWMYDDKVIFLSSEKEGFGFMIHSKDFADLMRLQFELVWKVSEPVEHKTPKKDSFLESIA